MGEERNAKCRNNGMITWIKGAIVSLLLVGLYITLVGLANQNVEASDQDDQDDLTGRMTGGGILFCSPLGGGGVLRTLNQEDDGTIRITHGFTLHCDPNDGPNNLQIHFKGANKF